MCWGDYDNDGDADLFVANDTTPNLSYRNNGDGTFTDVAPGAGVAFSEDGREQAGMGAELEDLNNDGWLDLFVTNFSEDWNTLRLNQRGGLFDDITVASGIGEDSMRDLSWVPVSTISTTTDSKICSWPTGTFIRRWTRTD